MSEGRIMNRQPLLTRVETAWAAFNTSYDGLDEVEISEPGVVGEWSVRDLMAHVSIWEEEALKFLPIIIGGRKPPRYAAQGGIDAFNARMIEERRGLSLDEVRRLMAETHRRLIAFIERVPEEQFVRETPFRHRLRLDTYSHYPLHAEAIRAWRSRGSSRG